MKRPEINPFSRRRSQAQAALDARNARYRLVGPGKLAAPQQQQQSSSGSDDEEEGKDKRLRERLERAERLVGKFVAQTIQPAVQRARSTPFKGWVSIYFACSCVFNNFQSRKFEKRLCFSLLKFDLKTFDSFFV